MLYSFIYIKFSKLTQLKMSHPTGSLKGLITYFFIVILLPKELAN